jgi:hypothetical protein
MARERVEMTLKEIEKSIKRVEWDWCLILFYCKTSFIFLLFRVYILYIDILYT